MYVECAMCVLHVFVLVCVIYLGMYENVLYMYVCTHVINVRKNRYVTYLPHKAVAEVSKDKEPIGRECAEFNWFENELMSDSSEVRFKWFWLSIDLRFKWFGCQSMCASNDFGCLLIWTSSDVVVTWFEIQVIRLSIDVCFKWFWLSVVLNFKWCGCQLIWGSSDLVVNWCVMQMILSNEAFVRDFLQNWSFETQKRSFSARLASKLKNLGNSKTKHFCETSFKNESLKIKNEAFLRDVLLKRSFEAQKRSFWSFEAPKRSISARLPSKMKLWSSKTKHFCETSFKIDMLSRHLTSEFQYVLTIFKWMLQKYCACHEKVAPRHTNSCNCHAKWSLQSNTSVTWNLQPFHGFSVGGFKHRHHKARNHCACHAKRIVPDPLQIQHACQRFCNPHELLRLPRILQRVEIPAPATRNTLWTSKNVPRPSVFNDFDFQIALARRRGAIFAKLNFQKCPDTVSF